MNDFKDTFKALKQELTLTEGERARMRAYFASFPEPSTALIVRPAPSPFSFLFARPAGAFALALALIVVTGGGVSLAAEGALPGEALYGVKIGLNERVERAVAVSAVAKAEVDIQHAEERLREVELLAAQDTSDERAVSAVALEVEERIERAAAIAVTLSDEGEAEHADDLKAKIASTLAAHADILEAQAADLGDEEKRRLRALSVAVSVAADDAKDRVEDDTAAEGEDFYNRVALSREAMVRERIRKLQDELSSDGVPEETAAELSAELALIEGEFGVARELYVAGEVKDASEAYEQVARRAYRAVALLTSARRINDKTGKEVVIDLDGGDEPQAKAVNQDAASEATMLMVAEDTSFTIGPPEEEEEERPRLRFYVRDRDGF